MPELAVGQLLCIKAAAGPFSRLTIQAAVHIEAIIHEKQIDTEMTRSVWIDVPGSLFATVQDSMAPLSHRRGSEARRGP